MAELTDARRDVNEADINVREEAVKAMDRTRLQNFRKLLNNLFESGKCYRIEEAMEHINFAKAEIALDDHRRSTRWQNQEMHTTFNDYH